MSRRKRWNRKPKQDATVSGNGTVIDPEVVDGISLTDIVTITQQLPQRGFFPSERDRLRDALAEIKERTVEATDRIIRAASATADFLTQVATEVEAQHEETLKFHRSTGA